VPQRRADPGRVDDEGAVAQDSGGIEEVGARDAKPVFRICLLGDKAKENAANLVSRLSMKFLAWPAAGEADDDQRLATPGDERGDSGQRNDAGRQDGRAKECIDERALAALELAENGNLQALVRKAAMQGAQPSDERRLHTECGFKRRLNAAERNGKRRWPAIFVWWRRHSFRRGRGRGLAHGRSPSSKVSLSPSSAASALSDLKNDSRPILASCARSQERISPR
jgi:hypothetical protein